MKIQVTLKDPDAFLDAIEAEVRRDLALSGLTKDERDLLFQSRTEKVGRKLERWLDCSEYVTLEFDTEAETAIVVEKG